MFRPVPPSPFLVSLIDLRSIDDYVGDHEVKHILNRFKVKLSYIHIFPEKQSQGREASSAFTHVIVIVGSRGCRHRRSDAGVGDTEVARCEAGKPAVVKVKHETWQAGPGPTGRPGRLGRVMRLMISCDL